MVYKHCFPAGYQGLDWMNFTTQHYETRRWLPIYSV